MILISVLATAKTFETSQQIFELNTKHAVSPLALDAQPSDSDDFHVLKHDAHPKYSLRLKKHDLGSLESDEIGEESVKKYCNGATSGYTGYLSTDNNKKHLYFAYFESRSNPSEDPLVMWLNGGPGCSSMTGLFMELGPCRVNAQGNGTIKNEYSWIEAANVFFLDQPIGVGFSWAETEKAKGTFAASEDIYAFMSIWYKHFPDSQQLPFSIAGESYVY